MDNRFEGLTKKQAHDKAFEDLASATHQAGLTDDAEIEAVEIAAIINELIEVSSLPSRD